MLKTVYNHETKDVTFTADVPTMRLMGISFAMGIGGPGLATHIVQSLVTAADDTSTDDDYQHHAKQVFQHIRDEHTENDQQKELVNIMEVMALSLPRATIMEEHFRQLGKSEGASESFNA